MIYDIRHVNHFFNLTGIMHVGAFAGEELEAYREIGLHNTVLFEPQPDLYNIVKNKCTCWEEVHNIALGSEPGEKEMYVSYREDGGVEMGSGASSSLMKPKQHITDHPRVLFKPDTIKVKVDILDNYYKPEFNFLSIDVQGYELEVLKGATNSLGGIDAMILEVNRAEVYEGCPMVEELDNFLKDFGFSRLSTRWQTKSWGDALYAKD